MNKLVVTINADPSSMDSFKTALAALTSAIGDSLERANKARDFCFTGGELLADGLLDFRCVAAPGTDNLILRLDVTDKFREFTTALAAGEFDGEIVERLGHGGPPVKGMTT